MGDILFLAHRMPFPPDRGDKIRSHHILKALTKLAPVHVGCFAETDSDADHEGELASVAATYSLPKRSKPVPFAGMQALATGKPVSLTAFHNTKLQDWVHKTIAEQDIDTIYVFSGQMGQYVPDDFAGRLLMDMVDVDSAKFEAYAEKGGLRAMIDAREGRLLSAEEERLAHRAQHTLFVSDAEAKLFKSRLKDTSGVEASALRNGIDTAFFDPANSSPHAELAASNGPHFVFTGQMDYQPNIDAAERMISSILPGIRETFAQAQFHIVGRAPVAALLAKDGKAGVRVWGEVPDVRPFVAGADVVVAPLTIARGVQNKVLEAMSMARPVLISPEAATGIDAKDHAHFAVEASDEGLIARAIELVSNSGAAVSLGIAARRFVVEQQGWDAMMAPLAGLVGMAPPKEPKRDAA